jgi:hypothetical protein
VLQKKKSSNAEIQPGMVAHVCNPRNFGGKDEKDHNLTSAQAQKKITETPTSISKLGIVVHTCYPSYAGVINRRITVQTDPGKKHETLSEK